MPERVLVISIDGLAPRFITPATMPTSAALARSGAVRCFTARTVVPPLTVPAHASMFRGVEPAIHGLVDNTPLPPGCDAPSFLAAAVPAGSPRRRSSAGRRWTCSSSHTPRSTAPSSTVGTTRTTTTSSPARRSKLLSRYRPDVTLTYLVSTDLAGHGVGWGSNEYLTAAAHIDALLADLDRRRRAILHDRRDHRSRRRRGAGTSRPSTTSSRRSSSSAPQRITPASMCSPRRRSSTSRRPSPTSPASNRPATGRAGRSSVRSSRSSITSSVWSQRWPSTRTASGSTCSSTRSKPRPRTRGRRTRRARDCRSVARHRPRGRPRSCRRVGTARPRRGRRPIPPAVAATPRSWNRSAATSPPSATSSPPIPRIATCSARRRSSRCASKAGRSATSKRSGSRSSAFPTRRSLSGVTTTTARSTGSMSRPSPIIATCDAVRHCWRSRRRARARSIDGNVSGGTYLGCSPRSVIHLAGGAITICASWSSTES